MAEQLGDMDLKVVSVADGEAALQDLRESPCDLLLTDLEMPKLDGLALVAAVRELPAHRFLPVLILSCRHPTEFEPRPSSGVTGWMVKPIDPEHLRRWVRRVLPVVNGARPHSYEDSLVKIAVPTSEPRRPMSLVSCLAVLDPKASRAPTPREHRLDKLATVPRLPRSRLSRLERRLASVL